MVLKMPKISKDNIFTEARHNRILVLEELDFVWDEPELKRIIRMWECEMSVQHIAERFNRDADEILLALIHLARKEKINRRIGGLRGK